MLVLHLQRERVVVAAVVGGGGLVLNSTRGGLAFLSPRGPRAKLIQVLGKTGVVGWMPRVMGGTGPTDCRRSHALSSMGWRCSLPEQDKEAPRSEAPQVLQKQRPRVGREALLKALEVMLKGVYPGSGQGWSQSGVKARVVVPLGRVQPDI